MEPTLHTGNFMLARKIGYKPDKGDIVIVRLERSETKDQIME